MNNNNTDEEKTKNSTNAELSWRETASPSIHTNPRLTPVLNKSSPVFRRTNTTTSLLPCTSSLLFSTTSTGSPAYSTASTSSLSSNNATPSIFNRSPVSNPMTSVTTTPDPSVISISPVLSNPITELQATTSNTMQTVVVAPVSLSNILHVCKSINENVLTTINHHSKYTFSQ